MAEARGSRRAAGGGRPAAARAIVGVCRRLDALGLIAALDGNVSVRLGPDRVLVTPAGIPKRSLRAVDLVEVDLDGNPSGRGGGRREPSSERGVHLAIYRGRPDIGAVVHAHPPTATGFATAGEPLPAGVLPELDLLVGPVAFVPFEVPGTAALAQRCAGYLEGHDAWLLANHGAVTAGATLAVALHRMESLEHAARILLAARLVGEVQRIPARSQGRGRPHRDG
jgi:L-fuculose-phosphate aldolase